MSLDDIMKNVPFKKININHRSVYYKDGIHGS